MVQAEALVAVHEAVEAEEAAGRVADDDIAGAAHALAVLAGEDFREAPVEGAAAGDFHFRFGDGLSFRIVKDEERRAFLVPLGRGRIDQVAERIERAILERRSRHAQEEARRQPRRLVGVALRLVLVDHGRVVDMRAENRLGAVAARFLLEASERVEPAIRLAAIAEVVEKFDMAIA